MHLCYHSLNKPFLSTFVAGSCLRNGLRRYRINIFFSMLQLEEKLLLRIFYLVISPLKFNLSVGSFALPYASCYYFHLNGTIQFIGNILAIFQFGS